MNDQIPDLSDLEIIERHTLDDGSIELVCEPTQSDGQSEPKILLVRIYLAPELT